VQFIEYLREVRPFASVEALAEQLKEDVVATRRVVDEGSGIV
jgi:FAD synthase